MRQKNEIRQDILVYLAANGEKGATVTEIARAIGVAPSTWLRYHLYMLYQEGSVSLDYIEHWSRNLMKSRWWIAGSEPPWASTVGVTLSKGFSPSQPQGDAPPDSLRPF